MSVRTYSSRRRNLGTVGNRSSQRYAPGGDAQRLSDAPRLGSSRLHEPLPYRECKGNPSLMYCGLSLACQHVLFIFLYSEFIEQSGRFEVRLPCVASRSYRVFELFPIYEGRTVVRLRTPVWPSKDRSIRSGRHGFNMPFSAHICASLRVGYWPSQYADKHAARAQVSRRSSSRILGNQCYLAVPFNDRAFARSFTMRPVIVALPLISGFL